MPKESNFISQVQTINTLSNNVHNQVFYQICGKPNHNAAKCCYRYDFSQTGEEILQALVVMNINEAPGPTWCVDIRAIAHMANDSDLLIALLTKVKQKCL